MIGISYEASGSFVDFDWKNQHTVCTKLISLLHAGPRELRAEIGFTVVDLSLDQTVEWNKNKLPITVDNRLEILSHKETRKDCGFFLTYFF